MRRVAPSENPSAVIQQDEQEAREREEAESAIVDRIASWLEKHADLWAAPEQAADHELASRHGSRAIRIAAARVRAGEWKK